MVLSSCCDRLNYISQNGLPDLLFLVEHVIIEVRRLNKIKTSTGYVSLRHNISAFFSYGSDYYFLFYNVLHLGNFEVICSRYYFK